LLYKRLVYDVLVFWTGWTRVHIDFRKYHWVFHEFSLTNLQIISRPYRARSQKEVRCLIWLRVYFNWIIALYFHCSSVTHSWPRIIALLFATIRAFNKITKRVILQLSLSNGVIQDNIVLRIALHRLTFTEGEDFILVVIYSGRWRRFVWKFGASDYDKLRLLGVLDKDRWVPTHDIKFSVSST